MYYLKTKQTSDCSTEAKLPKCLFLKDFSRFPRCDVRDPFVGYLLSAFS